MKPIIQAQDWCIQHDEDLESEIWNHLTYGWVYSGDDAFVLAMEMDSATQEDATVDNKVDTDTWYVYLYAGDLKRVLTLIPYTKKYIAFRRDNGPIKVVDMKRFMKKLGL